MFDFVNIIAKDINGKKKNYEVYPEFIVKKSKDLMTRGKSFYAIWNESDEIWCTEEDYISEVVDKAIKEEVDHQKILHPDADSIKGKYLKNFSSNKWLEWQKYVKSMPDNYHVLDEKIIFANSKPKKTDYASKRLSYELSDGDISAYDEIMNTLYLPEERKKLEWAIGAIISGDSKHIQKFIVLKGAPGTGKSTFLNIVQKLFDGYYAFFDAKAIGSNNESFALEAFKTNPLIAIQHDGDLSRIEDNTRLNQIISHESLIVNEKFKSTYASAFNSFLFMGTNTNVRISDAKSGIIRRLISVEPSGKTLPYRRYQSLMHQIDFELGGIAKHCLDVYRDMGENYYDKYVALDMIGATNDFFNFVEERYEDFEKEDKINLRNAWNLYKAYVDDARVQYPYSMRKFKDELKNYFRDFYERKDGDYSVYEGFLKEKFVYNHDEEKDLTPYRLNFNKRVSLLDEWAKENHLKAQYANDEGKPIKGWDYVKTTLDDIDSHKEHYILFGNKFRNYIVIDFDLKDENGKKDFDKNLNAASNWPPTYAELSKSGAGIHLHYIYDGDVDELERAFSEDIEIKVFGGKAPLRRKLTKCNDIPIYTLHKGSLPLKEKKMVDFTNVKDERHLRNMIFKNLRKEIHPGTKPSVDFIYKILDDAYESGMSYDVSDLQPDILAFANNSTNHGDYCVNLVHKMKFKSEEELPAKEDKSDAPIVFYDVEVFPNLFLVNWMYDKDDASVVRMINPSPTDIAKLCKCKLIGFNNRKYDNHIMYARMMGYSTEGLFDLSQRIISGDRNAFFREAYNLSYADVYDFSTKKQSLKKWEIELGIHHQELGLPWDQPVPEEMWEKVAEYCDNDVIATREVFKHNKADFEARQILCELTGLPINSTNLQIIIKMLVGDDKHPPLVYTDLSTGIQYT